MEISEDHSNRIRLKTTISTLKVIQWLFYSTTITVIIIIRWCSNSTQVWITMVPLWRSHRHSQLCLSVRSLSLSSSWETWSETFTIRNSSSIQNLASQASPWKPWSNSCTHIWCKNMDSNLWSSNGPLQLLTESGHTLKTIMKLHFLQKFSRTNVTRSSDTSRCTCEAL